MKSLGSVFGEVKPVITNDILDVPVIPVTLNTSVVLASKAHVPVKPTKELQERVPGVKLVARSTK